MILARDALRGSYPPLITPLRDGAIDEDAFARLVELQIAHGSHGIVVNGTTAEPATLTVAERKRLLEVALDAASGRLPVVAATGSQSLAETLELTLHADALPVEALLIVTPYYTRPPQRGLVAYYRAVAERITHPFLVYHIPGRTAVSVTVETLLEIAEATPHFVGMKHAVNDLGFVTRALAALGDDFRIFAGLEELSYPILAVGGCGLMNAVANLAPRRIAELYAAAARGDAAGARALHAALNEINEAVFFDTNPIPIKYMMRRLGLLERNEHRLPMISATPELENRLDGVLARAGLLAGAPV
ncbi:4-hydroxy-tetrahydrodipicolinate synthase [Vulcanimicrobium alpinum]|uniref:4-hydroxy-tetrahydrodipicolinate synthase n=1 Tax=Vulcanimicrobium alpinum TaxID=3016050 RepID=A0AAN1XXV5_UNVUL|nr:4-hydroxy-tetrahydrodipicolinate synthase [Vulcanimicrobium alpinum]BDE07400.1 4-hydroxy-tetrahydrodipicolinate synthase [Vulcanimicrobium alpinum]